jgi:hypothetical protein
LEPADCLDVATDDDADARGPAASELAVDTAGVADDSTGATTELETLLLDKSGGGRKYPLETPGAGAGAGAGPGATAVEASGPAGGPAGGAPPVAVPVATVETIVVTMGVSVTVAPVTVVAS